MPQPNDLSRSLCRWRRTVTLITTAGGQKAQRLRNSPQLRRGEKRNFAAYPLPSLLGNSQFATHS